MGWKVRPSLKKTKWQRYSWSHVAARYLAVGPSKDVVTVAGSLRVPSQAAVVGTDLFEFEASLP